MTPRFSSLAFFVYFCIVSVAFVSVQGADPDPLLDAAPNVTSFVLRNSQVNGEVVVGPGGRRVALNITIFPALQMLGVTNVQFFLDPCGVNLPHTHPRATELLTLISGGPIQAGIVNTEGEAFIYILYPGDIIVFPRGLLHYELNVGNQTAYFLSALNSQNPGTLTLATALLQIPTRAAASALNQDETVTTTLKSEIYPYSPALQFDSESGCVPNKDITIDY